MHVVMLVKRVEKINNLLTRDGYVRAVGISLSFG
jgi:hypothetical protein